MANVIVMHHPDLPGREIQALDSKQAAVFAKSGWKQKADTKTATTPAEEK